MLNFIEQLDEVESNIKNINHVLGRGLTQPFASLNSSVRKNMYATNQDQVLQLIKAQYPLVSTGYENEYGRHSSVFLTNETGDLEVIGKIDKYLNKLGYHYILLVKNVWTGEYDVIERTVGDFIGENYGFLYNNEYLDSLHIGSIIPVGDIYKKSISYDEYNNRLDGINVLTTYLEDHETTEDSIKISESLQKRFDSPLYHRVMVIVNNNDIMVNLFGNDEIYKVFPDIGEEITGNLLAAIRRENREESLYTLSYNRLKDIFLSDEKFTVAGRVVDINIINNSNTPLEEVYYNAQLNYYYENNMRYSRDIVNTLRPIIDSKEKASYDLKNLYLHHYRTLSGDKTIKDNKVFSNIIIEFDVLEINRVNVGDKITNRYGGKGVISKIVPDYMMPQLPDGRRVEMIINATGPVNRENPGQLIELSHNFICDQVLTKAECVLEDPQDFLNIVLDFYKIVSPNIMYPYFMNIINNELNELDKEYLMNSILEFGIHSVLEPITEALDIDKIAELYERFSYVNEVKLLVPLFNSNNELRYVETRRPLVAANLYMIRLKQYGKDKSSATSLSATNIKNEPTKPKTNKLYKAPYAKTPIRFGEMETGDMLHMMDVFSVVSYLLIASASPVARKDCKVLYTGNPFEVDITLNPDSRNRNVEILNAYFKTMGLRLNFKKVKREKIVPFTFTPFTITSEHFKNDNGKIPLIEPFYFDKNPIDPLIFEEAIEVIEFLDKEYGLAPFNFEGFNFVPRHYRK